MTTIEYALIAALVAIGTVPAMTALGSSLGTKFSSLSGYFSPASANAASSGTSGTGSATGGTTPTSGGSFQRDNSSLLDHFFIPVADIDGLSMVRVG